MTGASAGIGAEFARALARDGLSVVLTARREERLRELASELEKTYHVATRVVAEDLADPAGAGRVADAVADLEIAVLVNNAGFGASGRFDKLDPERLREMVTLNCLAPVLLTHRLLPGMLARGRGAIVITGSVAGRQGLPLHGVYSATKALRSAVRRVAGRRARGSRHRRAGARARLDGDRVPAGGAARPPHPGETAAEVVGGARRARAPHTVVSGWFNWLRANAAQRLAPRRLVTQRRRGDHRARRRRRSCADVVRACTGS